MPSGSLDCTVVIVGAGIAGLAAALEVSKCFPDVTVVEAAPQIGGRIKQAEGLLPVPVELGPHFIHGSKTILGDLIKQAGCNFKEYQWPDQWYSAEDKKMLTSTEDDADIAAVTESFESIGQLPFPAEDVSAEAWLRENGANQRMIDIAEACYANDFGCSLSQMGIRETILENQRWDAGEEYLVLDRPLSALTNHLSKKSGARILRSWPVASVDFSQRQILVKSVHGAVIRCQYVVIAVALKILQRQDIHFTPALPTWKQEAIERIQMSNAIKVVIILDRQIWPDDFFDVVCLGSFIPEFWIVEPADRRASANKTFGIVGFVAGRSAEEMSKMDESAIVSRTLQQLDDIFGTAAVGTGSESQDSKPATDSFVQALVADWSKEKYVGGAYSYPTLGAKIGDRDRLAAPVGDRLFFAGEATHPAVNPCLQAAYETGIFAANSIQKLSGGRSRL